MKMDDDCDDKDDTKRKSRNLSEKKRRDQFNLLVNELSSMVSSNNRKMDKSTVLKSTISFLKNYNEVAVRSRVHEIQDDWKPSYLSNEEFTHLVLEALDGFIIVFSSNGRIFYASESITSLLGHLPNDLLNTTIYDLAYEEDHTELYNLLLNPTQIVDPSETSLSEEKKLIFNCHLKRSALDYREEVTYELVQFVGYFRCDLEVDGILTNSRDGIYAGDVETDLIFVGIGRIQTPQLIREMTIVDSLKTEFTSRHSLEWKFLFLDHRAPPIIGYLPFEVLGTSGYDYYHVDDLDKVVNCHESLMQKGEGTSCYYRFLTKGQQWIWLQTRFFITYHQWNSKPEFVVCTHRVVSYADGIKQSRSNSNEKYEVIDRGDNSEKQLQTSVISSSPWSSKNTRISRIAPGSPSIKRQQINQGPGSDSTSISADSITSRQSFMSQYSKRSRVNTGIRQSSNQMHPVSHTHTSSQSTQNQTISIQSLPNPMFLEPPHPHPQYITTSSHHTVSSPMYQGNTSQISPFQTPSELLGSNVVITPAQTQIQDHLQRKHEELQQLIVHQQEELRRVSEQLLMARYGIIPTITLPFVSSVGSNVTSTITFQNQNNETQNSNPSIIHHTQTTDTIHPDGDELISYMQLSSMPSSHISHHEIQEQTHHQIHHQNIRLDTQQLQHTQQQQLHQLQPHLQQQMNTELGVIPFQMTQDQAQILFTSNLGSPHSNHQSQ